MNEICIGLGHKTSKWLCSGQWASLRDPTDTGIIITISTDITEQTAENLEDMSHTIKKLEDHQFPEEPTVYQRDGNRKERGKWSESKHEDKSRNENEGEKEKENEFKNKNDTKDKNIVKQNVNEHSRLRLYLNHIIERSMSHFHLVRLVLPILLTIHPLLALNRRHHHHLLLPLFLLLLHLDHSTVLVYL